MVPYIEIPPLKIGSLEFHLFGALVALGFIAGTHLAAYRAKHLGLQQSVIFDAALVAMVFGIAGAHIFHVIAYEPHLLKESPLNLLKFWSGLSSYGGFLGATFALVVYFRRKKLPFLPYADALSLGLVLGQFIGRIGCSFAHDHPGKLSSFFLAVQYPGGARHDLGFYEALYLIPVLLICLGVTGLGKKVFGFKGRLFFLVLALYAPVRFFFDFLRATDVAHADVRYLGLTPAQYVSIAVCLFGVYGLFFADYNKGTRKKYEKK